MGIKSDGKIYGVCWNIYDSNEHLIRRFEKIYSVIMTPLQVLEVKCEYEKLSETEKPHIKVRFYMKCEATYDVVGTNSFMCWVPTDKNTLESLFSI